MNLQHRVRGSALITAVLVCAGHAQAAEVFSYEQLTQRAKALAARPYVAPPPVPDFMRRLSYDQFRGIRFDPTQSLWHAGGSRFEVMLMVPGLFLTHPVKLNILNGRTSSPLPFRLRGLARSFPRGLVRRDAAHHERRARA